MGKCLREIGSETREGKLVEYFPLDEKLVVAHMTSCQEERIVHFQTPAQLGHSSQIAMRVDLHRQLTMGVM